MKSVVCDIGMSQNPVQQDLNDPLLDGLYAANSVEGVKNIPGGSDGAKEVKLVPLRSAMFNLANTTLGAGIVSIPFFFSQCGIVLGTVLLLIIAQLSAYASVLLVEAAQTTNKWSYMEIAEAAFGKRGTRSLEISILGLTVGVLSAFFVQIGDSGGDAIDSFLPSSENHPWFASHLFVKAAAVCFPLLPLASLRNLSGMANASLVVIVVITYLVLIICFMGSGGGGADDDTNDGDDDKDRTDVHWAFIGENLFEALPIMVLAFGNQINVHEVVLELQDPSPQRITTLIYGTNLLVSTVYLVIGIAGYARFGALTSDNIVLNYHDLHGSQLAAFSVARIGIVVVVMLSYPMLLFPCRHCLHAVLMGALPGHFRAYSADAFFYGETALIIGVTFFVAAVVPVLGTILGYTGAIAGTLLGFTFPALYHVALVPAEGRLAPRAMVALGVAFGVICLAAQIAVEAGASV